MQIKKYQQPILELRRVQSMQQIADNLNLLSLDEDIADDPFAPKNG